MTFEFTDTEKLFIFASRLLCSKKNFAVAFQRIGGVVTAYPLDNSERLLFQKAFDELQ